MEIVHLEQDFAPLTGIFFCVCHITVRQILFQTEYPSKYKQYFKSNKARCIGFAFITF